MHCTPYNFRFHDSSYVILYLQPRSVIDRCPFFSGHLFYASSSIFLVLEVIRLVMDKLPYFLTLVAVAAFMSAVFFSYVNPGGIQG